MSLRRRLRRLFLAYLLVVAIGGGTTAWATAHRDSALSHRRELERAVADTTALTAAYLDQEAGERGYLLTGADGFLEPYRTGSDDAARLVANLAPILEGTDAAARLDAVVDAAGQWRRLGAEPELALRQSGQTQEALALVARGEGTRLFDDLRGRLDELTSSVQVHSRRADDSVDRWRGFLAVISTVTLAGALVLTVAAAVLIRKWVTRPLAVLVDAVRQVRTGDLTTTVPAPGPTEIAQLGEQIEDMRLRLNRELDAVVRAREGLMQNATVLLSVRAQLESKLETLPQGWSLAAELKPAVGVVAGDCYDVSWVAPSVLGLVLVDVAGHGAESAVVALRAKELLRAGLRSQPDPGTAVTWASGLLDDLEPDMFVSAFVATVDTLTGLCRYANAGHPPPLLCSTTHARRLAPTGPIIGPFGDSWASGEIAIEAGQVLAMFTDGLVEARSSVHEEFGDERLEELVCGASCEEADVIVKRCIDEVDVFAGDGGRDDITIVLVCRAPGE